MNAGAPTTSDLPNLASEFLKPQTLHRDLCFPMATDIQIKRVYEPAHPSDGTRVLVDRVWPRGLSKEQVQAELWLKAVAPSTKLRQWFQHDRGKWQEFRQRYREELDANPEAVAQLRLAMKQQRLTLLFSSRDSECNQAVVLKDYLLSRHQA